MRANTQPRTDPKPIRANWAKKTKAPKTLTARFDGESQSGKAFFVRYEMHRICVPRSQIMSHGFGRPPIVGRSAHIVVSGWAYDLKFRELDERKIHN